MAPQWLGWKQSPIEYIHATKFYYELIRDGRIKIVRKIKEPVTYQEPCNIVRNAGYREILQYIFHAICENVVHPYPNGMHNYCCIAGGGVINCGPPWKMVRMDGNRVKAEQLRDTGAHIIISPCHNCHSGIEDLIKHYKLNMHAVFYSDLLLQCMELPKE